MMKLPMLTRPCFAVLNRRDCIVLALSAMGAVIAQAASGAAPRRLLVLGDSLSAEYGLARGTGWVALLEQRFKTVPMDVEVINASISGDTTAGGRARLPAALQRHQPSHVVIELGGNDALRGLPLQATQANLVAMVAAIRASGAQAMLIGMRVPPNYGAAYARDFEAMFETVARSEGTALVPFLLAGIADDPDALRWFQPDRIHPTAQAHPRILANVWPVLKPWLLKAPSKAPTAQRA
jgi:acyl-CoA thioesterase-1